MGNCVSLSIPLDQSVNNISQWLGEKNGYIHNLKKNLLVLEKTMEDLMAKKDTLLRRLTREEDLGLERLAEIQVWLKRVDDIQTTVESIYDARDIQIQRLCLCNFCSTSLLSSYRYGKTVYSTLGKIVELKSEVFEVIAEQPQTSKVEEIQLPSIIVGQETMLDKAWNHFMRDEVSIMGMHGMGGVGKTTLLNQLNNMLSNNRCGFEYVIWVVVSRELQIEKIQDEIAQKVGIWNAQWNQKERNKKSSALYNFLKNKRFVLLLDDIWKKVELELIGVPNPTMQNKCKMAFTTRSQEVCGHMRVDESMEVQCLADKEAYDLFQKVVGEKTLRSDLGILELARKVAKKCCGLPLALNIIGETMSCKTKIQEWRHAIYVLDSYASEFAGMGDKILPLLKYSYDELKDEEVQSCLLYCALFPEDAKIPKNKLIDYCTCEWKIDGNEGIEMFENKGYDVIGRLVHSSLLMEGVHSAGIEIVYMHDVVREMTLWVASDLGIQKEAFIVRAGVGLKRMPMVENWRVVRKMSLMNNKFHNLDGNPECMELTTLLLQDIGLENISGEFFKSMPKLSILDLSGNRDLEFLDGISKLVSLQYLNLSRTNFRQLPKDLQELKKLIHLDMEDTRSLSSIAGISRVHNLKVLKLHGSLFSTWDLNTVKELESLEHLEILTTTINDSLGSEQLLRSHRLQSRTQNLSLLYYSSESSGISPPADMDKLRAFRIMHCSISEIKMGRTCSFLSLTRVNIKDCGSLRELTFLMFAPNLQHLCVENAYQLEDIINEEKACEVGNSRIVPFQKLTNLRLSNLPKLKNVYWSPLAFSCLQTKEVSECENHHLFERRTCSFSSVAKVDIQGCDSLRELTFLMFAANLQDLYVSWSNQLEDIINKEKACEAGDSEIVPFQKLTYLYLYNLPKLKNIYWSPLPFPCLRSIKVSECENLKKLPINSKSGNQGDNELFIITEEKEWIEGVEWDDEATKTRFLASFKQGPL